MKYLLALFLLFSSELWAQAFKIGYLFDARNAEWKKDQLLIVEDGVITAVNPQKLDPKFKVIDLSKKWIIPGLIDAHTHLFLNDQTFAQDFSLGLKAWVNRDKETKMNLALRRARQMSEMGFTLARDLGNQGEMSAEDIKKISAQILFTSSGAGYSPELGQLPKNSNRELSIEYRKMSSDLSNHHEPLVKLYADEEPNHHFANPKDLVRLTQSAHKKKKLVAVHAILPQGIELALKSGADTLEHGTYISDEQLKKLSQTAMIFVPTNSESLFLNPLRKRYYTEELANDFKRICQNIKRAQQMNISVAFGSDHYFDFNGENFGENLLEMLASYKKCGMTNNQILRMATYTSAHTQNQFKVGELTLGYLANFNVYAESPALDFSNLKKVESIYRMGELLK